MASMAMAAAASLLPTNLTKNPATTAKRGLNVVAKATSKATEVGKTSVETKNKEESNSSSNGRRELVFAAAAAAACSIAKVAMAYEPKPGTPDAKKKYAPICVTMPTAKICRR